MLSNKRVTVVFLLLTLIWHFRKQYRNMCKNAYKYYLHAFESEHKAKSRPNSSKEIGERVRQIADKLANEIADTEHIPEEVDIVFSGGGFKNCYSAGVCLAIEYIQKRHSKPRIMRFSGASAGSHMSCIAMHDQLEQGLAWCFAVADTLKQYPYFWFVWPMWTHFYTKLAHENDLPSEDRIHISITKVSMDPLHPLLPLPLKPKLENEIISKFDSPGDLSMCLLTSGAIPFVLCPGLFREYRGGLYIDGGVTNNTPKFTDKKRPQVVIGFKELPSRLKKIVWFTKEEMVELLQLGMTDTFRFFRNYNGKQYVDGNIEIHH